MAAGRGAFLAPALVPMASSFVNLPRAFVQTFLSGPIDSTGATILELSWETLDGYVQRVCVAWVGGLVKETALRSDVIEIPAELARCCGIHELVEKAPQAFVGVHVVDSLPIARQVHVEPCTPDDWELIQLHAGLLESELLRQMCVVNDRAVSPIWVHQRVLIRIRVSLPVGTEHARLSPNTEVIVAPKERAPASADDRLGTDFYFEASAPLVVQAASEAAPHRSAGDEVWVHPETLAVLDGAVLDGVSVSSGLEPPVAAIWRVSSSETRAPSETEASPKKAVCSVVRLKCSRLVGRGRVVLSDATRVALDAAAHASVQLRVLKLPEIAPLQLTLKLLTGRQRTDSVSADAVREAFAHWLAQRPDSLVAHTGALVAFVVGAERVQALVHVSYDDAEAPIPQQQLDDVPIGAVEQYTLLGGRHGFALPLDRIAIETARDADARVLEALEDATDSAVTAPSSSDEATLALARSAAAYAGVKQAIRSVVYRDAGLARVLLGSNAPGSPLVYGDRGSGKTTLLRSLVRELETDARCLAYSVVVECRALRGVKMETVKRKLADVFDDAAAHAPAVVVLDNLDALVPEEDESAGPANEQSRRIAELLVTLLQQTRARMWETTRSLQRSYHLELAQLQSAGSASDAARTALLASVATAMAAKSVAVVATARSDASVHKSLRSCGLFDRPVHVLSPDAERRETLIRELLALRIRRSSGGDEAADDALALDPAIDFGLLASLTEGYSIRDLVSATDRALHRTFVRTARSRAAPTEPVRVLQSDFVDGVADFQPTALIGVDLFKSSVQWSDVGGLHAVRTVLKDTLELPTRYSKLYDNTPIKLPAGMLLYGPPGCGKTLLASAVANECGLNFISVKGPEVLNKYIGASEQAIRDLFARAASAAPSVLFLDEFDSIAPRRGADNTGVTDRLVNQLLTFLDGVEGRKGVYVLAATSRPDMIDPALLRPGRLDKSLYCGFPTEAERADILRAVSKDMALDAEAVAYLTEIAAAPKSDHFSGADLQAIMYSAQLELVHEKLQPGGEPANVIRKRHVQVAFESAKPSTSVAARLEFETMYANFSRARTTDFAVAAADASASPDKMKSPVMHQRTALA